jgi:two-component system, sporulation sensor kinase A
MPPMSQEREDRVWLWITLVLSCITILTFIFAVWELIEQRFFRDLDFRQLHFLYVTRGVASSVLLAGWAVWFVFLERRKSEDELRRSWKRYHAMLEHAADAVVLFDSQLRILEWNPHAAVLYGYDREAVLGQVMPTLGSSEEKELRSILQRLQQSDAMIEIETKRRTRSGEWVDAGIRISSFADVETGQRVFLEMAADLGEKIRLRQRALEVEKLTSMGRLAAGTAHTLNTPLAAMLLRIEMLKDELGEGRSAAELSRLELSTRFCQDFVQKLLQYSRPSESAMRCVEVAELVDSICTFFKPTFQLHKQTLRWNCQGLRGIYVVADRNQMEALFAALLMNALDAVAEHGEVSVEGALQGEQVVFWVRDDGCGVPADKLGRIFEPFFTTKEPGHGTGLGLSIAHNIVSEHGGAIGLSNNPDRGVTVEVCLPLCHGKGQGNGQTLDRSPLCITEVCPVSNGQRNYGS